jgi:large subunit ribosomal protein L22
MSNTKNNKTEEKIVKVSVKNIAQSPFKLRLVADMVRGMKAEDAVDTMKFLNRKGALTVKKAILSGIENAVNKYGAEKENITISKVYVDGAKVLKRAQFATKGRMSVISKRRSHLNLELKVK